MKRYILVLFTAFFHSYCIAQDYTPFINNNSIWIMDYAAEDYTEHNYFALVFGEEYVVSDTTYVELLKYNISELSKSAEISYAGTESLIREDEMNRKVYSRGLNSYWHCDYIHDSEEKLLYDFSLTIGDSTHLCKEDYFEGIVEEGISSFFGYERRYLKLRPEDLGYSIIEGIGYRNGIFGSLIIHAAEGFFLVNYCNGGTIRDCIQTVSSSEIIVPNITVFPNPVDDIIYVEGIEGRFNFQIFNMLGELVSHGDMDRNTILVGGIPIGQYFVRLNDSDKSFTLSFVKE